VGVAGEDVLKDPAPPPVTGPPTPVPPPVTPKIDRAAAVLPLKSSERALTTIQDFGRPGYAHLGAAGGNCEQDGAGQHTSNPSLGVASRFCSATQASLGCPDTYANQPVAQSRTERAEWALDSAIWGETASGTERLVR
jgi:hypothetical protein